MKRVALIVVVAALFAACKTVPTDIPEDLSQAELVQLAQESTDNDNWDAATAYYQAVLDRFPQDKSATVTAQYEIGFIYFKQGDFDAARAMFEQMLAAYDFEGDALPQWPKILAEKLIAEMESETAATGGE